MPHSSMRTATIQACILNVTSSILAQLLKQYRKGQLSATASSVNPLDLDVLPILQFLFWCMISTPPNVLWQEFLERQFPGYPATTDKQKIKVDDDGKGVTIESKLDLKNTAIKLVLDQTLGALVNNAAFLVGITILQGGNWTEAVNKVRLGLWPIMIAAYKVWPLVSILNFTLVPVERRIVVGSFVGLFWGIFMVLKVS